VTQLSTNFTIDDFTCPCCGDVLYDLYLIEKLQQARTIAGIPFLITSGFRCAFENKRRGGDDNSAHLRGMAADIAAHTGQQRYKIIEALLGVGLNRLGIYERHIHVDVDQTMHPCYIWYGVYK